MLVRGADSNEARTSVAEQLLCYCATKFLYLYCRWTFFAESKVWTVVENSPFVAADFLVLVLYYSFNTTISWVLMSTNE